MFPPGTLSYPQLGTWNKQFINFSLGLYINISDHVDLSVHIGSIVLLYYFSTTVNFDFSDSHQAACFITPSKRAPPECSRGVPDTTLKTDL